MTSKYVAAALALLTGGASSTDVPELKVGGPVQDAYKTPFELWANTTNNSTAGFTVKLNLATYNDANLASDCAAMTTDGNANYVDVLICPYASSKVRTCVDAVAANYTGPIMIWGGASDSIFDTNCANKNCFGTLTVASQYMSTGLAALDALISGTGSVAIIANSNGFSSSVADGAEAFINATAGLESVLRTAISVQKKDLTAADKTTIQKVLNATPDIVVIAGHNGDVEPVIEEIGNSTYMPKAILAVNGLTKLDNYQDKKYAKCVMMPTQWDDSTTNNDSVVGWTSADFHAAMKSLKGSAATYQEASAAAVGVALSNAMSQIWSPSSTAYGSIESMLVTTLQKMDVDSFYGKLKWDSKGIIAKPMYTQQMKGDKLEIVAPTGAASYPLSDKACWGTDSSSGPDSSSISSASAASAFLSAWVLIHRFLMAQ